MSFTDPFNRVSCKRDKEYQAFHEQLKTAGIDTEEQARTVLQRSRTMMLGLSAVVVAITLVVSLVWPDLKGIVIVFASLVLLWIFITMTRGQRMMKQFIEQTFSNKSGTIEDRND